MRKELPEYADRFPEGSPGEGEQQVKDKAAYAIDASKAKKVLGVEYTSFEKSMKDSFLQLFEAEKRSTRQ